MNASSSSLIPDSCGRGEFSKRLEETQAGASWNLARGTTVCPATNALTHQGPFPSVLSMPCPRGKKEGTERRHPTHTKNGEAHPTGCMAHLPNDRVCCRKRAWLRNPDVDQDVRMGSLTVVSAFPRQRQSGRAKKPYCCSARRVTLSQKNIYKNC